MASHSWRSLEKPLNQTILAVIENEFKFEKMTPVQVRINIFGCCSTNCTTIKLKGIDCAVNDFVGVKIFQVSFASFRKRQFLC